MPTKISEKHLLTGIVLLLLSVLLLFNTTVVKTPLKLSEKGLMLALAGIGLFAFSVRAIWKSIYKA